MKVIYYYQTFVGLEKLKVNCNATNLMISSIHFGDNKIDLNDKETNDEKVKQLWEETESLSNDDLHISCMVGGAGGAFRELFSNFDVYYETLRKFLISKPWIQGINLDIEETVTMENIKKLISRLRSDFGGNFLISMAPVSSAMESDVPGMGGFVYKELFNSPEGEMVDFYNWFSLETYKNIIDNGYPEDKIVMGMMSGQFTDDSFVSVIHSIKEKYPDVSGFYDWEYLDAPPNKDDPSEWAKLVKNA